MNRPKNDPSLRVFIIEYIGAADGQVSLTDMARHRALRFIHFGKILRACEKLVELGLISHTVDHYRGDCYQMAA